MQRKDFEIIAGALKESRMHALRLAGADQIVGFRMACDAAAEEMASALARTNSRFDRECFLRACGVV